MSHENTPQEETPETLRSRSEFSRSVNRLFDMLDEPQHAPYYKAEWSSEQKGSITEITTMHAKATGARKQERRGKFSQAQFKLTETSATNEESQRFIWLPTDPQPPGTPIELSTMSLAEVYEYHALEPGAMASMLATHASSIDDYSELVAAMNERDIKNPREVTRFLGSSLYRLLRKEEAAEEETGIEAQAAPYAATLRLLELLQDSDHEIGSYVQGRFLSRLLRVITEPPVKTEDGRNPQDEAAMLLEVALRNQTIFTTPHMISRICSYSNLYKYPFATHLLYDRLQSGRDARTYKNIFGAERTQFTHRYTVKVLEGLIQGDNGDQDTRQKVADFLKVTQFHNRYQHRPASFAVLLDLAMHLDDDTIDVGAEAIRASDATTSLHLMNVSTAFLKVLRSLKGNAMDPTAREDFDLTCAKNIDILLEPVIYRKLGKETLAASNTSQRLGSTPRPEVS